MGFGGEEEVKIKDGGDVVSCSICLDVVCLDGDRSTARLQCGHQFHLDCIGSAFNAKGSMQCPNCRKIEKGSWLYANGTRPLQEVSVEEWASLYDEDLYDVNYSEMPFRLHWCPFGRLTQLPSLFEEGESAPPVTFHDFMGQHALFAEQLAISAASSHPYVAYLHPLQPSSSSSNSHTTERTMDGTAYHDQWSQLGGDGRPLQTVHPVEYRQNHWAQMSHSYAQPNSNNNVADQSAVPLGAIRTTARPDNDGQQRGSLFHPSFYSNGSGSRSRNSHVPPLIPQFMRAHGNVNEHYQQNSSSVFAGTQRSGGLRPVTSGGPAPPPLIESTGFCLFPPGSSGPGSLESDDVVGNQFYAWERDRFAPYPLVPVECETSWWGSSQQSHTSSDTAPRRLFGQWISVDGSPQQSRSESSYRQMHAPRM